MRRAFSRQYTSKLFNFDEIGNISALQESSIIPEGVAQSHKSTMVQRRLLRKKLGAIFMDLQGDHIENLVDSKSTELATTLQPLSLQCRVLNSVYVIHVSLLLARYWCNIEEPLCGFDIGRQLVDDVSSSQWVPPHTAVWRTWIQNIFEHIQARATSGIQWF